MRFLQNDNMSTVTLYPIIVLYNKRISESNSIKALNKYILDGKYCNRISIYILDNSDSEPVSKNNSEAHIINTSCKYVCMNGNVGLSRAYNYAVHSLIKPSKNSYILWLDDDTDISSDFIDMLFEYIDTLKSDIFVPWIIGQDNKIYSPNTIGWVRHKLPKSQSDVLNVDKIFSINSCLAVNRMLYEKFEYDDNLFLDCVDNYFFDYVRKAKASITILPISVRQNFFQRGDQRVQKIENIERRYRNRIRDNKYYLVTLHHKILPYLIRSIGWSIVNGLRYHSFSLMFSCLVETFKLEREQNEN